MRNLLAILISLTIGFTASASPLLDTFKKLDSDRKGPFDKNMQQGTRGRVVTGNGSPAGTLLFQAAFRNQIGKDLAKNFDFYVGNLFTTNYYELMGEYVYNDQFGSHDLDHTALRANSAAAMPKASSMVRHWVMEKYYLMIFPHTKTANAFRLRGISDLLNEQEYSYYFLDFYLSSMTQDSQYLPAYLLTATSAIASSANLDRARSLIASLYEDLSLAYGTDKPGIQRLYQIRNAVHNQLSAEIIGQIDKFIKDFPASGKEARLLECQSILKAYYAVSASKVADLAKKAGLTDILTTAEAIKKGGTVERYLLLSQQVAALRASIMTPAFLANAKKTDSILVIQKASQLLNKELGNLQSVDSKDVLAAVVNLVYAEGFLIKDNWQYFIGEINNAPTLAAAAALVPDIVEISNDTLAQAFTPSYAQWTSFIPKMSGFVDNTIKSSALNTASLVVKRIK